MITGFHSETTESEVKQNRSRIVDSVRKRDLPFSRRLAGPQSCQRWRFLCFLSPVWAHHAGGCWRVLVFADLPGAI